MEYNIVRLRCRAHRQGSKFGAADTDLQRAPASIPKISQFETDLEHISHIRSKYVKYCQRPSSIVKKMLNIFLQKSVKTVCLQSRKRISVGRRSWTKLNSSGHEKFLSKLTGVRRRDFTCVICDSRKIPRSFL